MDKKADTGMGGRSIATGKSDTNEGRQIESMGMGQKMSIDYGKDHSSVHGAGERTGKIGGGVNNLAHSLSGTSAVQTTKGRHTPQN